MNDCKPNVFCFTHNKRGVFIIVYNIKLKQIYMIATALYDENGCFHWILEYFSNTFTLFNIKLFCLYDYNYISGCYCYLYVIYLNKPKCLLFIPSEIPIFMSENFRILRKREILKMRLCREKLQTRFNNYRKTFLPI